VKLRQFWLIVFSVLLLVPVLSSNVFAAGEDFVAVSTGKEAYAAGETISVIGQVSMKYGDEDVILQVVAPNGNMVDIAQVDVGVDNNFTAEIFTSIGGVWQQSGTYTILAHYFGNSSETEFDYGGTIAAEVKASIPELSVVDEFSETTNVIEIGDQSLSYELTGAQILKIIPDTDAKSLIIQIKTFNDGELKITLPKEIIDTDEEGFFVLVDGEEVNHEERDDIDYWTLTIPFYMNSEEIEIIGTFVIPEFGTIAMMILAMAIVSIIILSSKSKLNLVPKM
jgi:predicted secreted protein with PEFG-CTERM motif|tara:strand:+ start:778 stop:1620 length:843 start_codon:yes stop_codon:yes gene_type:complete